MSKIRFPSSVSPNRTCCSYHPSINIFTDRRRLLYFGLAAKHWSNSASFHGHLDHFNSLILRTFKIATNNLAKIVSLVVPCAWDCYLALKGSFSKSGNIAISWEFFSANCPTWLISTNQINEKIMDEFQTLVFHDKYFKIFNTFYSLEQYLVGLAQFGIISSAKDDPSRSLNKRNSLEHVLDWNTSHSSLHICIGLACLLLWHGGKRL